MLHDPRPFLIYRSSAGSGKTFRLALEYLKLALRHQDAFRQILGVTFTNKATEEMKVRILEVLRNLSGGHPDFMQEELKDHLGLTDDALQQRASEVLSAILHQYGRFAIVTIDSFFHQVIRSFAREMGLQGTFSIDLDIDKVLQRVIDNLLAELGEIDHKELRKWLISFASNKVEEGKPWDFRQDVLNLAKELVKDSFKPHALAIMQASTDPGFFENLQGGLKEVIDTYEKELRQKAEKAIEMMSPHGGAEAFSRKASGPAGLFLKVAEGDYTVTDAKRAAIGDLQKWLTKESMQFGSLVSLLQDELFPVYEDLIVYIDDRGPEYNTAREASRYLYTFGILFKVNQKLQQYRDEEDTMLIADLPDFLNQIIQDSDTPYIYEKVGSRFSHYLIDEFQDTSGYQWRNFMPLVKNATDEGNFSMVVGDVKQSIYRWRGGDWRLLQNRVKQDIGEVMTRESTLSSNWRSSGTIVQFNNDFFQRATSIADDQFEEGGESVYETYQAGITAYDDVAQKIQVDQPGYVNIAFIDDGGWIEAAKEKTIHLVEDLQRKGYHLRDIAILTRRQKEGKILADAFMSYKSSNAADPALKYEVVSSEALYLYSSQSVRFIISMLKWIHNQKDDIALTEWLYDWSLLSGDPERNDIMDRSRWQTYVSPAFRDAIPTLQMLTIYELVERIIDLFRLDQIKTEYTYLQGFQDAVLDFTKNEKGDIPSFLEWWENVRKDRAIQISDENDAVKILTIHKAKGLEYPVVILPFLNWKMDQDFSKEEILWAETKGVETLESIPVIPLRYTSSLKETVWKDVYWNEKISSFIDNLNLLYVAFTRPTTALYAFGEMPKSSKLDHVGKLTYQVLENDLVGGVYENGSLPIRDKKEETHPEFALEAYSAKSWRNKVRLQMKGSEGLSTRSLQSQRWGIQLHTALSSVRSVDELYEVNDPKLKREIKLLIHHEQIEPFFKDLEEVKTEQSILLPGGKRRQVDRLIKKEGKWIVIDFKTGSPRQKDHEQVRQYMEILGRMGSYTPLEGYLIYLDPIQTVAVTS